MSSLLNEVLNIHLKENDSQFFISVLVYRIRSVLIRIRVRIRRSLTPNYGSGFCSGQQKVVDFLKDTSYSISISSSVVVLLNFGPDPLIFEKNLLFEGTYISLPRQKVIKEDTKR
jgi:hypothetical protein